MTKEEFFEFQKQVFDEMCAITRAKNADYTGIGQNPFSNFTRVEAMGICSTEQGFLTRMTDKMSRIASFVQKGELQVKDESVMDTLKDLANYSVLMMGYLKMKQQQSPIENTQQLSFDRSLGLSDRMAINEAEQVWDERNVD